MFDHHKIFVSITAFNEPDILFTIQNAIKTARYPGRINFGLLYHNTNNDFFDLSQHPNVRFIRTDHDKMLGVGLSRQLVNSLYLNEEYYLQIDAHTIFDTWWDERLINNFWKIKNSGIEKPIITQYAPPWYRQNGEIVLDKINANSSRLPVYDNNFAEDAEIPLMSTIDADWKSDTFHEHYGISAHFIFTSGNFCLEINPDPQILFYGEEPTLALRAWTRGYRMFAIRVPALWHKTKVGDNPAGNNILDTLDPNDRANFNSADKYLSEIYYINLRRGIEKTRSILTGEILGHWGAPTIEDLKAYEQAADVSFKKFYEYLQATRGVDEYLQ